jgi:uncharacterized protein YggE
VLLKSGVAQKDIQTSRFSIQPVYAPQEPGTEPKLAGYSISNQVTVRIGQIDKVGEILDSLITAGVTNIGIIQFLVSEPSNALDQAREAAVADARRKAEVYAHASGIQLGRIEWITEDSGFGPMRLQGASGARTEPYGRLSRIRLVWDDFCQALFFLDFLLLWSGPVCAWC